MLTATDLKAGYRGRVVLDVPALTLEPGKITVFIGPNGSGKSTLLRSLAGTLALQRGTIQWKGQRLFQKRASEIARIIAYVPQETAFPFAFTPQELVAMGSAVSGGNAAAQRTEQALALFEMEDLAHQSLTALSGGERQRASLARAFAQNSYCLLLDEPTSHLDLCHQVRLFAALQLAAHQEHKTVGVVLHDLNFAASIADNVVLLVKGQVIYSGASRETLTAEAVSEVFQTKFHLSRDTATGEQWFAPTYQSRHPS